jgi:hypothetical protein
MRNLKEEAFLKEADVDGRVMIMIIIIMVLEFKEI